MIRASTVRVRIHDRFPSTPVTVLFYEFLSHVEVYCANLTTLTFKMDTRANSSQSLESSTSPADETIKVFLRMKPVLPDIRITKTESKVYSVLNSTTLLTRIPSLDCNTSCLRRAKISDTICKEYTFTQTFGPETTQLELFDQAVKMQIVDFLAGKNSTVMSYGTSNSGKTFTLQGTTKSPGLIPHGIDFVFKNIIPETMPNYKPINKCDVICLNPQDRIQESQIKLKLFTLNLAEKDLHVNTYKKMQSLFSAVTPIKLSHYSNNNNNNNIKCSIWVSYAEIYNETIYDLLWLEFEKKRPALKLGSDSKGRAYIKGLNSICVNTATEAYQVYMAGQNYLKVASTALNYRSSRSHCIFTIKLLKYKNENDPDSVEVSSFNFCDLAGSERLKKTLNTGERLKETQNINLSLLVLGKCLRTIHESQCLTNKKNESIVSFRESKLTKLLERALLGKELISIIVTVNPDPNLYKETENVLNFSAIAKNIVFEPIEPVVKKRRLSQFSRLCNESNKTRPDWENTEFENITETSEISLSESQGQERNNNNIENVLKAYKGLLAENELLKKENKQLKDSTLMRDMETRKELIDMFTKTIGKIEDHWRKRCIALEQQHNNLREVAVERTESFYKEKLSQINVGRKAENALLVAKIAAMENSLNNIIQAKERVETEKTKISFDYCLIKLKLERVNQSLLNAHQSVNSENERIAELEESIRKKDDKIETTETLSNEIKEEYEILTDYVQNLEEQLKERDRLIIVNSEETRYLKDQLDQRDSHSAYLAEMIENLEENINQLNKRLNETKTQARITSKLQKMEILAEKRKRMASIRKKNANASETAEENRHGCNRYWLRGCPSSQTF